MNRFELKEYYPKITDALKSSKANHNYFCTNMLKIATKSKGIEPFILNSIQLDILNNINKNQKSLKKSQSLIILKARQQGVSTFVESYLFSKILLNFNKRSNIISHSTASSNAIFEITKLFYNRLPEFVKMIYPLKKNNAKIISIDVNNSMLEVSTAEGKEIGRGYKINYLHGSEVAFWTKPNSILASIVQAVADNTDNDNLIIYESTANGNNFFRDMFEDGLKNGSSFFYGWNKFYDYKLKFNTPEERKEFGVTKEEQELAKVYKLSAEQINWRRKKLIDFKGRERLFNQEYPICWQDAFVSSIQNTLIDSLHIYKAAENNDMHVNDNQPIIVGIDPARDGGDRTVITVRQARKIINIFVLLDKTAPELEGFIINNILNKYKPDRIFIDHAYGIDIVDHLRELGYKTIEAIAFNSSPLDNDRFTNIRSEMHEKLRDWFMQDGGVSIPNNNELINELSIIPDMKINSLGKLYMVPKDDIKELNRGKSPDYVDSLALTFAKPVIRRNGTGAGYEILRVKSK